MKKGGRLLEKLKLFIIRHPFICGILLLVIGLLIIIYTSFEIFDVVNIMINKKIVNGIIINENRTAVFGKWESVTYSYFVNNNEYKGKQQVLHGLEKFNYNIGDKIEIIFNQKKPQKSIESGKEWHIIYNIFFVVIGFSVIFYSLVYFDIYLKSKK